MKEVFDQIAPGWYNFRHWSIFPAELEEMARRWRGGKLLNVGCGHGADFLPFREGFELYGVDISPEMLKYAGKYADKFGFRVSLEEADVRRLPYPNGSFDWAISVATYHHLRGRTERLLAMRELRRVLRPGGEAFITVWNRWQWRFRWLHREAMVPWRIGGKTVYRYYYLFTYPELKRLAGEAGLEVLGIYPENACRFPVKYFSRNICLLVRRRL